MLVRAWLHQSGEGQGQGEAGGVMCVAQRLCRRKRGGGTGGSGHAWERKHLRLEVERFQVMSFEVWL